MQYQNIAFIGAGNMTQSIIGGLVQSGYPAASITATNRSPEKLEILANKLGIQTTQDNRAAVDNAEIIILAVKPQMMREVCNKLAISSEDKSKLFISIAAGMTIDTLSESLNNAPFIVRAMPNTPSLLGYGMTGLYAAPAITHAQRQISESLMASVGEVLWVENEANINGVIAAAGSSPAYFFAILEAMQAATQDLGFNEQDSRNLVQQAMLGAAKMVIENPDISLATLRAQVTSKGGATAKAIEHFQNHEFSSIVQGAMNAAVSRSKEMEANFS